MTGDLRVQCITRIEDVLALKSDWLDLEIRAGVDVPFQTWEWTIAWWNHLREDRRAMRDNLRVCVVRDQDQRAVAIAPLILTERPSVGPLRVRYLHFVGAVPRARRAMCCRSRRIGPA
jgi:CelD/BcsL family acetyltransferase involved in cellulose biosynthesis